jgi:hypothetical protein
VCGRDADHVWAGQVSGGVILCHAFLFPLSGHQFHVL